MTLVGSDANLGGSGDDIRPSARRRRRRAAVVHIVGVLAYLGALVFALVSAVILVFMTSYSGATPSAGQRYSLTLGLMVVSCIVTAVPAFTGVIARQMNTASVPWFVVAAITALYTLGVALSSHPLPGGTTTHF